MKRNLLRSLVLMIGLGASGLAMAQDGMPATRMTLSSPAFKDMEPLPLKYTQTGTRPSIVVSPGTNNAAVNPPIEWSNVPAGTNAFVLMLYDHVDTLMWAVVNIPGDTRSLPFCCKSRLRQAAKRDSVVVTRFSVRSIHDGPSEE